MSEAKWDDGLPHPDISKDDIEGLKLPDIRAIGQLGAQDIEALLVGYLIHDPDETMPKEWEIQAADAILESGIKGSWFEDKQYGESFEFLLGRYKVKRQLMTPEDAANLKRVGGMEREKADVFTSFLVGCLGAVLAWKVRADIVIKLKWNRHSWNVTNNLWKRFQHEYGNEAVGPEKAIENLRKDCTKELATPGQGIIKEHDWISDYESLTGWAKDMKTNPEKYRGCCCGISTIDERTNGGFRPGHLTVFVGRPGGYKTTMLLNIAHGLWNAGYDVLYVSLEMEAKLLELKFWCRATGELDYTKLFRGLISEPGDRQCLADVTTALTKADLNPEEKAKLESQKRKLEEILAGVQPGNEDSEILARFEQSSKSKKNRIKIINIGQSKKIRMSQIERYLRDVESDFRPQVVIIDYCSLTLVAPETPYPDRPDLELGEICTYMRNLGENMGFSVITAAQLKRAALERIRKYGEGAPEKAQIGTDDIAESHQISAAADTIFVLWPMANSQIKIFCPKARHAGFDMSQGETLQVCDLQCMISTGENIQSHTEASKGKSLSEGRKQNLEIFNNYDKPTDSEPLSGSGHFVGGGGVKSLPVDF